jgi:hypothetical protein
VSGRIKELENKNNWSTLDYCAPLSEEEKEELKNIYSKLDSESFTIPWLCNER